MTTGLGAPVINLRGFTIGQTHAITPQYPADENWDIQDSFTASYNAHGRHDLKLGGEYMADFTYETVCQTCMGQLTANNGPVPANIESLIADVNDVSTWNLAPLSSISTIYLRNVAMEHSTYNKRGQNGFTEYPGFRHVLAWWAQDDWAISSKVTLNLGMRYDAYLNEWDNYVEFKPFLEAGRSSDLNNLAPRVGFNYAATPRTVIRGGYGRYTGESTSQIALFTLRYSQQIAMTVNNDGRPDFAVNPFNGPAPNYEQAKALLCAYQPNPGSPTCNLRHSTSNFAAPDLVDPWSHQASLGVQRQIGAQMSVEADWVFTGDRQQLNARNINVAYNPATGAPYPFAGGQAAANYVNRPYPGWGNIQMNRSDDARNYHALQTSFTKRMANHWQASATYTLSRTWQFDQLPLNPGCQYPMTINAAGKPACDVPITLAKDVSENAWYVTGAQRSRATFNGIWEAPHGFQISGLYIFGDNGYGTPSSGVDARSQGSTGGRLRANGTLIERNSFNIPAIHRVDLRLQRRFAFGPKVRVDGIFEMYNVFNRSNFESFTLNESNAKYGQPLASTLLAYQPRMLQFGFRTQF